MDLNHIGQTMVWPVCPEPASLIKKAIICASKEFFDIAHE